MDELAVTGNLLAADDELVRSSEKLQSQFKLGSHSSVGSDELL